MAKEYNPQQSIHDNKFLLYVAWVDHNMTLEDKQQQGVVSSISPQTGRNLHIGGFKLNGEGGGITLNVLVPQDILGSFKMPQLGDVVWIEERRRFPGDTPVYLYSTYNSVPMSENFGPSPVPHWGSFPNDYGHIRSYKDHARQFSPQVEGNFITKYVKSATGYRFRHFFRGNLKQGKFAVRGDPVFDIDGDVSREYIVGDGTNVGYGDNLETDQSKYPNPHNTPASRETDDKYTYYEVLYKPISQAIDPNHYNLSQEGSTRQLDTEQITLKNKGYVAYEPIMDKKYLHEASFERELPAADEYQVSLRGNNKLLIQDQYGDGEQLIITLKSQYDEQFTIVHNGDKGQVRIRDHMGQGVLMEADPDAPRVVTWTANNQRIEQGSVKGKGEFTYIRNGEAFGSADTSSGTDTGTDINNVSNQEFLMVSSSSIIGELSNRLSSGMNSLASAGNGAGLYFRNNTDPDNSQQTYSMYNTGSELVYEATQEYSGLNGQTETSTHKQTLTGSSAEDFLEVKHDAPGTPTSFTATRTAQAGTVTSESKTSYNNDADYVTEIATVDNGVPSHVIGVYQGGTNVSTILQDQSSVNITRALPNININVGTDGMPGTITIGNASAAIKLIGSSIDMAKS